MDAFLDKDTQIELLKKETELLKQQNKELQERLSKYSNPDRNKNYQERNKELLKEYHKQYYIKKKTEKRV
jgi:hypothetical protein